MKKFILIVTVLSTLTLSAQKKNYTLEECVRMALEKNINIKVIAQASTEISIIIGVSNSDYKRACIALYDRFY